MDDDDGKDDDDGNDLCMRSTSGLAQVVMASVIWQVECM